MVKRERERERNRTIPPGNVPGLVDRCIISSNWNVFEPGAAHTATKQKKNKKKNYCYCHPIQKCRRFIVYLQVY